MDLTELLGILMKYGSTPSLIIAIAWAYLERMERGEMQKRWDTEREMHTAKLEALARESIVSSQNSTFAVSTLTSLLAAPKRDRG